MPITLDCPNCKRRLSVPDSSLGKKVRCPECQAVMECNAPPSEPTSEPDAERLEPRQVGHVRRSGIAVGVLSAGITLLAFVSLGVAAWLGLDGSKIATQVCVYSAIGLSVVGLLTSLSSRGILRALDFLFAAAAIAANVLGMLIFSGVMWPDAFHDFAMPMRHQQVLSKPFFETGDEGRVYGDEHGQKHEAFGFIDEHDMRKVMLDAAFPGARRGGRGKAGGAKPAEGSAAAPEAVPRDQLVRQYQEAGKLFVLAKGTRVRIEEFADHLRVQVLEGPCEGKTLWLWEQTSVHRND